MLLSIRASLDLQTLNSTMVMDENWICWLYQYGIGGAVFFSTIFIAKKTGAFPKGELERKNLSKTLILGYVFFLSVHAAWIYSVVGSPFVGRQ